VAISPAALRAGVAACLLVCVAGSVWVLLQPHASDCDTARKMLDYSVNEDKRIRDLIAETSADPSQLTPAYERWASTMHTYAGEIRAVDLRAKAQSVANLDSGLVEDYKRSVRDGAAASAPDEISASDQQFAQEYLQYASQHKTATQAVLAACPEGSR
jgi:hypothetical protein